mgnify:CR=1 FL=1
MYNCYMDNNEAVKININNLIAKRTNLIQGIYLIMTGTIGLLFVKTTIQTIILLIAGLYFAFKFSLNCMNIENKINNYIKRIDYNGNNK